MIVAGAEALDLGSVSSMSSRRLSTESGASVTKKSVVSPFSRTGLKRCGFGGLLSRPAVHAASRDGEDRSSSAVLRNLWREEEEVLVRLSERSDLSYIGTGEEREEAAAGGEATKEDEANRQRPKRRAVRIQCPLQKTFQLPRDLSYTRRAWQKLRHRLGSFPQPATRGAS